MINLAERKQEVEQKFEQKKAEREQYTNTADECLVEMHKLQGEYRLIEELEAESEPKQSNKQATVIEAVPKEK